MMEPDLIDQYREKLIPKPKPKVHDWPYLDDAPRQENIMEDARRRVVENIQWNIRRSLDEFIGRPSRHEYIETLMRSRVERIMIQHREVGNINDYSITIDEYGMEVRFSFPGGLQWNVMRVDLGGMYGLNR